MVAGLHPSLHPDHGRRVRRVNSGVPHIAVGIWVATAAVLILPSFGRQRHEVTEDHLIRAYGVAMSAFPLL